MMLKELTTAIDPKPQLGQISVVIPTLGRPILEACLSWLAEGKNWPGFLIVVDQGRNSKVAAWLQRLTAAGMDTLYVPSNQRGRAAGINRGLEQVTTRFVAITDDDCFVDAAWLSRMVARLQHEPTAIVTGRVEQAGDSGVAFSTVTGRQFMRYETPQLKVHPFIGGNVGLAMALVERIGLFDEHPCLQSAEDSDYGYRALRLGIPIVYDPDVVVHHYHWRDAEQRATRYADYARSQGGFYGTHLLAGDPLIWVQTARALVRGPVRWARGLLLNDAELVASGRASSLGLPPGIIAGLRRRQRA